MEYLKLYFIGFMGSGKTTISKTLCKKTGAKWIDVDREIEKAEKRKITDIFAQDGEDYFRQVETKTLREIANRPQSLVVSCGGGTPLRDENIEIMRQSGEIIWLSAAPQTIFEHVRYSKNRPILNGHMNVAYISELLEKRLPYYEKAGDFVVKTDGRSVDEIVDFLKNKYFT